jgi:azurin
MNKFYLLIALPLFLTACSDSGSGHDHAHHGADSAAETAAEPATPVSVLDGVTVVEMTGNDRMKFNLGAFSVPAGGKVKLTFRNLGKMPKAAMGHNVVFLTADADENAFAAAAASARDTGFIPEDMKDQVLAKTKLLGPGESDTVEFTAPTQPGDYIFLCSFPAHMFAGMRGVMTVE